MKNVTKKVRHGKDEGGKSKVVAEVDLPVYETVDELIGSETDKAIVAMFNNANHIRIMGNERAKFSGTATGKGKRREMGFNCLSTDELMSVAQDAVALEALIFSEDVQARVDAKLGVEATE